MDASDIWRGEATFYILYTCYFYCTILQNYLGYYVKDFPLKHNGIVATRFEVRREKKNIVESKVT